MYEAMSQEVPPGGQQAQPAAPQDTDLDRARKHMRRHLPTKVAAVLAVGYLAFVIQGLARNKAVGWKIVGHYLFARPVLEGLGRTMLITVAAIAIAIVLGVVLANMRLSSNRVLNGVNAVYVWFFRSVPLLVLLILAYNFSLLYESLSVGIPFGPQLLHFSIKNATSGMTAAIATFGLQQAAYTSEVIRSAISAIPKGQTEAAQALGMTRLRLLWRVVLPQAARVALPPIGNETINLCKSTSLVAFISVPDLLYSVQEIYAQNFDVVPLLVVATIWYIAIVSLLSLGQWRLETRLAGNPSTARSRQATAR